MTPDDPDPRTLADLSALADGSLPTARVPAVEAQIAASPALTELLEREVRAVDAVRAVAVAERAPHRLRLEVERRATAPPRRRARVRWAPAAGLGAIAAAVLAVGLTAGGASSPTVAEAASIALRGPAAAAPAPDPQAPGSRLDQGVDDVYFPRWNASLGWRAVGQRTDRLAGHHAVTVYYRRAGASAAYTILTTPPLSTPNGTSRTVEGVVIHSLVLRGRRVVTWRRGGHTCVISSADAPLRDLQQMAAWSPAHPTA